MEYAGSSQPRQFRAMAPQVAGTMFAVTLAFMLLLPFVRLSLEGAGEPETLLFLTKTDFGVNIFALILLLMPVLGVVASLALKGGTALMTQAIIAVVGLIMIPLTALTVGHDAGNNAALNSHVAPGMGLILVTIVLGVLAITSGIAAAQARR